MPIPSYDDLAPSIPDVSPEEVFASVARLLPAAKTVARREPEAVESTSEQLFACLRAPFGGDRLVAVARDFSPRIQRYDAGCVVLDVAGLGRLLGDPETIGAELARAAAERFGARPHRRSGDQEGVNRRSRDQERLNRRSGDQEDSQAGRSVAVQPPRFTSRYGIRIEPHPAEHVAGLSAGEHAPRATSDVLRATSDVRVAIAPTQVAALLLSLAGSFTIVTGDTAGALVGLPLQVLQQLIAAIHGVTVLRQTSKPARPALAAKGWPAWPACAQTFDVVQRWGVRTLGDFAALPSVDLAARLGESGVALQQIARGVDPQPLVPDPDVPRFLGRMELEWPIDALEPLSFVLARLLEPLSAALERADRGAAAIRLDLRLVDRSVHRRLLQLPAVMRDPKVLRTLLVLDLESHPPSAAIDIVSIEIDPAPGRVLQYSLLERAIPSAETIATLTARLAALVGETRCGTPVLLDSYRPDAFDLRPFAPVEHGPQPARYTPGRSEFAAGPAGTHVASCLRRFRPPVAVRVSVEHGRPVHVAIDRRGMPGGRVTEAAGPWRSSGEWWSGGDARWTRDEWDVSLSDGSVCRLFLDRERGGWFMEGLLD